MKFNRDLFEPRVLQNVREYINPKLHKHYMFIDKVYKTFPEMDFPLAISIFLDQQYNEDYDDDLSYDKYDILLLLVELDKPDIVMDFVKTYNVNLQSRKLTFIYQHIVSEKMLIFVYSKLRDVNSIDSVYGCALNYYCLNSILNNTDIHWACLLIEMGADTNIVLDDDESVLCNLVKTAKIANSRISLDELTFFVKRGHPDVNFIDSNGDSVLLHAIRGDDVININVKRQLYITKLLIEQKASVSQLLSYDLDDYQIKPAVMEFLQTKFYL
jgi:hypothetical protein